jgi:redox-sensing transcriptional repressor
MTKPVILSEQALKRLPRYLLYLKELQTQGCAFVTAPAVARQLGLNEVQVRKELSLMSTVPGKPRTGFSISDLIDNIETYLGYRNVDDAVLVGVGSLGHALLGNRGFDYCGVHIVAAFDRNEAMDGLTVHDKPVFAVRRMVDLCRRMHIRIGIITVSPDQAQYVCDQLVSAGVLAIWNFAPVQLRVPDHVIVRNEDLSTSLAMLAHQLQEKLRRQS